MCSVHRVSDCAVRGRAMSSIPVVFAMVGWLASLGLCVTNSLAVEVDFEREIAPLLVRRCLECHGAGEPSGGLNLSSHGGLLAGGDSGPALNQPAVVLPDSGQDSEPVPGGLLLERVLLGEMPPEKNGKSQRLSEAEIELLQRWVAAGAVWPENRVLDPYERTTEMRAGRDWWSLQPLSTPAVPALPAHSASAADIPRTSDLPDVMHTAPGVIDAFVLQQLQLETLEPAPPAERTILLRRLYYDLIGLPPTAEESEAFAADRSPDAYERRVDRLLSRPEFGERWARYWLDVVRYAETNGYERDAVKPHAWRYRDWVVAALNTDLPYDRFIIEQLAGDELDDRNESTVIATGFLRLGTWDDEPNDPLEYQYDRLEDLVHVTTTAFLGLTVKCARCHDHKFDPIPQVDYYRMGATFWGGPVAHRSRDLAGGPSTEELGYDVLGWTDLGPKPPELRLLRKGNVHRPAEVISAGSLTVNADLRRDFAPAAPEARTAQRRLQLARWIAEPTNPLTPRVAVNRLWLRLFGEGLVRTPDNFGFQGSSPSHPDLLDWLTGEFLHHGMQIKPLIRLMVLSRTYRQSSLHPLAEAYEQRDPDNRWLWRANRRRLDAEALRDSILWISGHLDQRIGGPSFRAVIDSEALEGLSMKAEAYQASSPEDTQRRSLYMFVKRSLAVPMMTVFDCCDNTTPAGRRDVTIVAPQALTLLNNRAIWEESRQVARILQAAGGEDVARIRTAWRRVLARDPGDQEIASALSYLAAARQESSDPLQPWVSLCHVLINTNEFIYID
jgi:hypothetical protein